MNYEKKYKEALDRAKQINNEYCAQYADVITKIFPELAESKDEKIRKEIIYYLCERKIIEKPTETSIKKDWIAWLEKQGNIVKYYEDKLDKCACDNFNKGYKKALEKKQGEKTNPYSGIAFEYNGHIWGMCARDNGVDILLDRQLFRHLEKQGKKNLENSAKTFKDEQNHPANKVEPKFKVGDWVVNKFGHLKHITKIENDCYYAEGECGEWHGTFEYGNTHFHLWTIQDAKDGDVLVSGEVIFIFNLIHGVWLNCHCSLHKDGSFNDGDYDLMTNRYFDEVYPATKEQCDLLFQKMKEAGYE